MKKIILVLLILFLSSCTSINNKKNATEYDNIIEMINSQEDFNSSSEYFKLSYELVDEDDDVYRFYLFLDQVKVAMYDVNVVAIEKGKNYSSNMAANVGIFDDKEYNLLPNQTNPDLGYYSGIMISGVVEESKTTLYILVQWKNKDLSQTTKQFIKLDIKSIENEK